jgi:Zn-dependent protease with chaperone function
MSVAFALLFLTACAFVAFASSLVVGLLILVLDRFGNDLNAQSRAGTWLVLASFPAALASVVVVGAFGPWAGLAPDHCGSHLAEHVHLCFGHPIETISPFFAIPAAMLAARVSTRLLRACTSMLSARSLRLQLLEASERRIGNATVLAMREPVAFVVGWFRPTLFVTSGLLARPVDEVAAVLAHERAHAERRDPLRRLATGVLLGFHLPGIADALERRLGLTQEMAADEHAAGELGDPLRVAESLISVSRTTGSEFACEGVSARVVELLRETPRHPGPSIRVFAGAFAAFLLFVAMSAGTVHHLLEHALSFLGA